MIADHRLNALAVTSVKPVRQLPDLPTVAEAGVPGFDDYLWMGTVVPAATPQPIVDRLAVAARRAVQKPETIVGFDEDGVEPVANRLRIVSSVVDQGFSLTVSQE